MPFQIMKNPLRLPIALAILFFVVGCTSTEQVFVAQTDAPESPTLAVVPANNSLYQHSFANQIEGKVLEAGLTVVQRPSTTTKEVTQEAELGRMAEGDQAVQQVAEITQTYSGFSESDADYLITTFASPRGVRIVERSTDQVLASFELQERSDRETRTSEPEDPLREALEEIGLPVAAEEE